MVSLSTHLRSKLPVEIIDMILQDLGPRHLQPLLTVNSFFYSITLQQLYRTIVLHSPTNSINRLFRTLLWNPSLPPLVRASHVKFETVSPTRNLYLLSHSVLLRLSALASLTIELPRQYSPMWIFEGWTFKLTQFRTSHHCRLPPARFLDSQSGITDLMLRGFQNDNSSVLSFLNQPLLPPKPNNIQRRSGRTDRPRHHDEKTRTRRIHPPLSGLHGRVVQCVVSRMWRFEEVERD